VLFFQLGHEHRLCLFFSAEILCNFLMGNETMRRAAIFWLGTLVLAACSSTDEPAPGSTGSGGTSGSAGSGGGSAGTGGTTSATGGSGGGETGGADTVDGSSADVTNPGSGGGDTGEADAGEPADAAGDAPAATHFTCNAVLGIHTTAEWFEGGFETQVDNARWEIIDNHPGYVANWAVATDPIWATAPASACTMNSTNPDRVVFNAYADQTVTTYTTKAEWVTGLTKVVANIKAKFSNVKRIDLLTMTRAPGNQPCKGNVATVVAKYIDDAIAEVAAADPGVVFAAPPFYAPSCDVFMNAPHFTTAGKAVVAKVYGDYYSKEP
jgi:hypothetical protein